MGEITLEETKSVLSVSWPKSNALPSRVQSSELYRFALFASNFFRYPTALGTLFPSSRFLIERTLKRVSWAQCGHVIELGPGTGHFTREILKRLPPDGTLITIEINVQFAAFLRRSITDPRLRVFEASAANMRDILDRVGCRTVDCVIAGIPFSRLPRPIAQAILTETREALRPGGLLLIYQFSKAVLPLLQAKFGEVERDLELRNALPTRIFSCVNRMTDVPANDNGKGNGRLSHRPAIIRALDPVRLASSLAKRRSY